MRSRIKTYLLIAVAVAAYTNAAFAQWHSRDSRKYFDYGEPLMTSVIQSPDGHVADVRITTSNSMFSFLHSKNPGSGAYYAIRNVTIDAVERDNEQPILSRNVIDTIYAATFDESIAKNAWHAMDMRLDLPTFDSTKKYSLRIEIRDNIDRLAARPVIADLHSTH